MTVEELLCGRDSFVPYETSDGSSAEVLSWSPGFNVGSNGDVSPGISEESVSIRSRVLIRPKSM